MEDIKHCDDYIHDYNAPKCLRFFLLVNRMPAVDQLLLKEFGVKPALFAYYDTRKVRVTMASRLGDVGITRFLDREEGYDERVPVSALTGFTSEP